MPHRQLATLLAGFALIAPGSRAQPVGAPMTPAAVPVPAGVTAYRDVAYVPNAHERQQLDLYVPAGTTSPVPVIVWVHGGGWANGDKSGCPPLRQGFVQRGYAVASVNYRLSHDAMFPAQLEDCKAAIRWLRANAAQYHLRADRFAAWGSSAGGHLVALLGTTGDVAQFDGPPNAPLSSRVQCVIDDYGPTLFTEMDPHRLNDTAMVHNTPDSPESRLIGGWIGDAANAAKVARANPITYVSADDPPFLIVHGDRDPLVPHHQSELLFAALQRAGVRVRLNTVQGGGHGTGFGGAELEQMRRDFLDHWLRDADTDAARWPAAGRSTTAAVAVPVGGKQKAKSAH